MTLAYIGIAGFLLKNCGDVTVFHVDKAIFAGRDFLPCWDMSGFFSCGMIFDNF